MKPDKLLICIFIIFAMISVKQISCANSSIISSVRKMIIDTDAGADDAAAIFLALGAENLNDGPEILAITCVSGNAPVDLVALNVLKTLKVVNRLNIPVYKGASQALLHPTERDNFFGQDGFGDFYYPDPPSVCLIRKEHAVNVLIELVKNNPGQSKSNRLLSVLKNTIGEITVLALGPLTNIALAMRLYPPFLNELQQLIVMGGSTDGIGNVRPGIEFNFFADPVAAFAVFNATTSRPTTLLPFDTVQRIPMAKDFKTALRKLNNPISWLIFAAESAQPEFEEHPFYPADMVAAIVALTSGSIVTKSATFYADIVYYGKTTAGMIIVDYLNIKKKAPNVNLIKDIDPEEFIRLIFRYYM